MKLWERYFLREAVKVFLLFLCCFFLFYALLDYSLHMQDFIKDKRIQFADILSYYWHQFIKRAPLLIPLALLVSTIKVLSTLNTRRELVALQAAAISAKRLTRPFLFIGVACTLFSYINTEFLLPSSLNHSDQFYSSHFKHGADEGGKERMHILSLKDNSKLIYQTYDVQKDLFFDVLWLRSADDIWRIKTLQADPKNPIGKYIDHLVRNPQGIIEKTESFDTLLFDQMRWRASVAGQESTPVGNRKLSDLYRLSFQKKKSSSYERSEIATQMLFKTTMPLLSLLCVIAAAPFCIRYTRKMPQFFIYSFFLFGFIAFYVLMDAAVIVGENRLIPPLYAILIPFFVCSGFFTLKFIKMR